MHFNRQRYLSCRMMTKENETSGITKEAIKNNSDSTCIFKNNETLKRARVFVDMEDVNHAD